MGEVELSTGVIVKIDTSKLTRGQWRKFGRESDAYDAKLIESITGISSKDQDAMLNDDFRRIVHAIARKVNSPLSDPNFQSASTSGS